MPRVFSYPGIYKKELDLSTILIATGISNGGLVGRFQKGRIRQPVQVSNDKEFIEKFGAPYYVSGSGLTGNDPLIPEYGYGAYAALEFLKESQTLYVVRAFDAEDVYAAIQIDNDLTSANTDCSSGIPSLTATPSVYDTADNISSIEAITTTEPILVGSVSPGLEGNDIAITVETLSPTADWLYRYDAYPSDISATTSAIWTSATSGDIATHFPVASKVFKLKVYKKEPEQTWDTMYSNSADKAATKLRIQEVESYYGTLTSVYDGDGNDLSIETAINGNSKYVYVKALASATLEYSYDFSGLSADVPDGIDSNGYYVLNATKFCELANGAVHETNGLDSSDDDMWDYFLNREELPVQILINSSYVTTTKQRVGAVVARRMDCIATNQVGEIDDVTYTDIINSEAYGYIAPSYVSLYCAYSKVYDNYNDAYVWLPNSIYGASLFARCDNIANPWDAPAGITRGVIGVLDQNKILTDTDIGKIFDKNINCVKLVRGTGFVMWGQKTAQLYKSALSDVNVRRLLLYIENNIEIAMFKYLFENNTTQTRLRAWSEVDEFLAGVQAGGGFSDTGGKGYNVVCDETNNPASVIDANQMNLDFYIKPPRAIYFLQFSAVVLRSNSSVSISQLKYA
jgi:hypothetical protein